jgi:hypothetical protein
MFVIGSFLLVYVALATWVAWLADRRGRSFWTYFVFCLIFPIAIVPATLYLLVFARRLA